MDFGLNGKVAIVTGVAGEQGIGRAVALSLAAEGCDIVCADIVYEGAREAAAQISSTGRRSLAVKVDQGDYQSVRACVASANEWGGGIDIMVNNAALMTNVCLIRDMPVPAWDREMAVGLSGPFYFIKEVLPIMMKRKWGRIINISSLAGRAGIAGRAGYCTAKAGLIGLTKAAALEGARSGVTVNVFLLGMVDSAGMRDTVPQKDFDTIMGRVALHRPATCGEVGQVAAFYASEQSGYITGAEVIMDGGQTMLVLR